MSFHLALLHSTTYIFFLYCSLSSSSCSVVEAVSSNIGKALILQPSANIIVCGDFNAHNTEWLCYSPTTNVAGLFCQEFAMAPDLTQIVDFPTRIPVYSYSKADWDGSREHLRDVPSLDIMAPPMQLRR